MTCGPFARRRVMPWPGGAWSSRASRERRTDPRLERSPNCLLDLRGMRRDGETAGSGGGTEKLVVLLDLVRVGPRVVRDRLIEHAGSSQITRDRRGVSCLGVRPG